MEDLNWAPEDYTSEFYAMSDLDYLRAMLVFDPYSDDGEYFRFLLYWFYEKMATTYYNLSGDEDHTLLIANYNEMFVYYICDFVIEKIGQEELKTTFISRCKDTFHRMAKNKVNSGTM